MKIKCILTDTKDYNSFCGLENSIYTVRISKQYKYWYYDLCDMIGFYHGSDVDLILDIPDSDMELAESLYGNHRFDEKALRDYETAVMVHTTALEAYNKIMADGAIKCWNILKQQSKDFEDKPIGSLNMEITLWQLFFGILTARWFTAIRYGAIQFTIHCKRLLKTAILNLAKSESAWQKALPGIRQMRITAI